MPEQKQPSPEEVAALQEKLKNMSPEELKEFQKKQCVFCQIISGKIPAKKVYEDQTAVGILDINPANAGHVLLLPKEHYSILPQIPPKEVEHLFMAARIISNAILKSLEASGTNIIVANGPAAGQRAQHFMIHVIPRKDSDGVEFTLPQKNHSEKDLEVVRNKIAEKLGASLKAKKPEAAKHQAPAPKQIKHEAPKPKEKIVEAVVKEEDEAEHEKKTEPKPSKFVTSEKAKRFHTEDCPFGKIIPEEQRIYITQHEAEKEGKAPCSCTGLVKAEIPKKKPNKKVKKETPAPKKKAPEKDEQKKKKAAPEKKEPEKKEPKHKEPEDDASVNLDDIARLF